MKVYHDGACINRVFRNGIRRRNQNDNENGETLVSDCNQMRIIKLLGKQKLSYRKQPY